MFETHIRPVNFDDFRCSKIFSSYSDSIFIHWGWNPIFKKSRNSTCAWPHVAIAIVKIVWKWWPPFPGPVRNAGRSNNKRLNNWHEIFSWKKLWRILSHQEKTFAQHMDCQRNFVSKDFTLPYIGLEIPEFFKLFVEVLIFSPFKGMNLYTGYGELYQNRVRSVPNRTESTKAEEQCFIGHFFNSKLPVPLP